jgi:peptidoglycan/LPS O-acetylase OafA/YrhL
MSEPQNEVLPRSVWVQLTGMRGVCAFYVLVSHIWFQVWPAALPPLGYGTRPHGAVYWLTNWLYHGHYAVIAFIVISGFSLQCARLNRADNFSAIHFLARRCRRILPPYYAAMVLSAVAGLTVVDKVTGSQWDVSIPVTTRSFLTHALLLQDVFDISAINYTHWSIAAEFQLYFMFPVFVWLLARYGIGIGLGIVTAAVVAIAVTVNLLNPSGFAYLLGLIAYFCLGIAAANYAAQISYRCNRKQHRRLRIGAVCLLTLAMIVSVGVGFAVVELTLPIFDIVVAVGVYILILSFLPADAVQPNRDRVQRPAPTMRILEILGRFSYSLYLVHAPIVAIIWSFLGGNLLPKPEIFCLLLVVATPSTLVVSYLFYYVFERPFSDNRPIWFIGDLK